MYNPESDKLARGWGKRKGDDCTVHLCLSPLDSVHKGVLYPHTAPTPRAIRIQRDAHCRQWTRHSGHGAEPSQGPSHPSLLPAQRKSQCHLPSSGSGAFLFMSVHLGRSPSELIVLFFYRFFCPFFFFFKKGVSSHVIPLRLQVRQSHPVFHQHNVWPKLVCALLHCGQDAEQPLVQGIQVRVGEHR